MAILENRYKVNDQTKELSKLVSFCTLKKFLAIGLVFLSLQTIHFGLPKPIHNITFELSSNLIHASLSICEVIIKPVNNLNQIFSYFKDLETENAELKIEIANLKRLKSINNALQMENAEFRKILQIVRDIEPNYTMARLLSVSINAYSQTALIAAGSNDKVEVNQVVTSSDGVLIGKIIEVGSKYSKVMLVSDFNSRIPVITSISRERAILAGGKKLSLLYFKDNHNITVGESLITSGDGTIYPYGIEVANITKADEEGILAKSLLDFTKVNFVIIQQ